MRTIIFFLIITSVYSYKEIGGPPYGGIYERVPPGAVQNEIKRFLRDHNLDNCYAKRINNDLLSLKCWTKGRMKEVTLSVWEKEPSYYI